MPAPSESTLAALTCGAAPAGVTAEQLPFTQRDVTAGTENELQTVVVGRRESVDLPVTVEQSSYYASVMRHVAAGETPPANAAALERHLRENAEGVWENSWVRFPRGRLCEFACSILDSDLFAARRDGPRSDAAQFEFRHDGEDWLRVPTSYLLKLALADLVGRQANLPPALRRTARRLMSHFSNDNTSPETFSFYVVHGAQPCGLGPAVAREMAQRFLLTHLLVEYANKCLGLEASGQRALAYFAPHPPVRQRELNECIPDAFYRELFMSPCLSGFDDGEAKRDYMHLAHRQISRSRLNAVAKLREAGVISNNLVVLPNTSDTSLANNGTHLSLGSRKLSALLADPRSGFTAADEKRLGDLVLKICEHFLPLFVGTYTAAPYRLSFSDFHPEAVLGFLPHELDYTHLRMLWRHWKQKARLRVFGRPLTPYGPVWLDRALARLLSLRGDLVPDFRLVNFPVAWLSTDGATALDGILGNVERLKCDLDRMGVIDRRLKLYLPMSLREHARVGFSGFEGRHYSLFESIFDDFAPAASLQQLVTVLAFKYALSGELQHRDIPDDPSSESERRQPFFYAALGLPAFNARELTPNILLQRVVARAGARRASRRRGYVRVGLADYRRALLEVIRRDGAEVVELLGLGSVLEDLEARLEDASRQAHSRLTRGVLARLGGRDPLARDAREFNQAAESFYREELRRRHLKEALDTLRRSVREGARSGSLRLNGLGRTDTEIKAVRFLHAVEPALLSDDLRPDDVRELFNLLLLVVEAETYAAARELGREEEA